MKTTERSFIEYVKDNRSAIVWSSLILIVAGVLMQGAYVFAPEESLAHRPFEEDTFFHLSVCRNLAAGKGLTIDGDTPTSGAQPGTLVYTLAYLLARDPFSLDALRLVRAIGLIGSLFSSLAVFVLSYALLSKDKDNAFPLALLSSGLWTASYQVFRINLNGYETVFASSALLLSVSAYVLRIRADQGRTLKDFAFGTSLALAIYARIDMGIWALCASAGLLFFGREGLRQRLTSVGVWALTAAALTLPFWYHNFSVGGSLMPISGKASAFQMSFHGFWTSVGNCLLRGFNSLGEFGFLSLYIPYSANGSMAGLLAGIVGISLIFGAFVFCRPIRLYLARCVPLEIAVPVVSFMFLLFAYYVFAHGSWWFMRRYMHPERALFFALSGVYLCGLAYLLKIAGMQRCPCSRLMNMILALFAGISIGQFVLTWGDRTSNQMYEVAKWINGNITPTSKIGAFQSGTLGYFCRNIVNLDGKNNPHALEAMTQGRGLEFIKSQDIEFVVDWPSQIAKYVNYGEFLEQFDAVGSVGAFQVYRRR